MSHSLPSAAAIDKATDKGAHEDMKFSVSHITPEETERLLLSDGMWVNFPWAIGWIQHREFPEFERAASFWACCEGGRKIVVWPLESLSAGLLSAACQLFFAQCWHPVFWLAMGWLLREGNESTSTRKPSWANQGGYRVSLTLNSCPKPYFTLSLPEF